MDYESGIRPISYIKTHAAEIIDAIGLLKLMAHSEHDIEAGLTVSHADAISRARGAISDE